MEESEADTDSETEASEDDEGDLDSDDSGAGPASPRRDTAASMPHAALDDGAQAGTFGLDASSGEGLPREVTASAVLEDEDMEDADDVPQFLPEPSRPPGVRPPYRGLSITIPPDDGQEEEPGFSGRPAATASPGLSIRIWKVRRFAALSPALPKLGQSNRRQRIQVVLLDLCRHT